MSKLHKSAGRPPKSADVRSEGQRLLIGLLAQGGTIDSVAAAVGCSRSTVQNWRTGDLSPSPALAGRLFGAVGIPARTWGVLPGAAPGPLGEPLPPSPATSSTPSTMADCLALHAVIRRARNAADLTPAERVKLTDTEARILALRHRLEREADMLEDRIVREHPKWQTLKHALVKVLAGCPRCSRLVLEELTRLDM